MTKPVRVGKSQGTARGTLGRRVVVWRDMHRTSRNTALLALALLTASACTGTAIEVSEPANANPSTSSMQPSKHAATAAPIPLIDQEAPSDFQTATFALG